MEGPEALEDFEFKEQEALNAYIAGIQEENEELKNPIVYGPNPFFELELKSLNRLAFAVADNPFMKTDTAKYYPEVHIIDSEGNLQASIGPRNRTDAHFAASLYTEGFRDDNLKINDDRKVKLTLNDFTKDGMMLLLTVRCYDVKKTTANFSDAWFRLQNEDTN